MGEKVLPGGWGKFLTFEMLVAAAAGISVSAVGLYKIEALAQAQVQAAEVHANDVTKISLQTSGVKETVVEVDKRLVEVATNQKHFKTRIEDISHQLKENNRKQDQMLMLLQQIRTEDN